MALFTLGTLVTVAGAVWKYWRLPVRFYKWHKAQEIEPAVGQVWMEAGFSTKDVKWLIGAVEEDSITMQLDGVEDAEAQELTWDDWALYGKKHRMFCLDCNDSIEDTYWGKASED